MHRRTEDLLSLRDDEPMDAPLRERLLADPQALQALRALQHTRDALRALPDPEPPPLAWDCVQARLDVFEAPGDTRPRPMATLWRWSAGGAIAAGVAVAALWLAGAPAPFPAPSDLPSTTVSAANTASDRPVVPVTYASAIARSERLDQMMNQLPPQRSTMNAATASLIAGLEDRVAWLDQELLLATAHGVPPEQRVLLWNERVEMMNALLHLRYAQAQGPGR